jgi:hypothetical protein
MHLLGQHQIARTHWQQALPLYLGLDAREAIEIRAPRRLSRRSHRPRPLKIRQRGVRFGWALPVPRPGLRQPWQFVALTRCSQAATRLVSRPAFGG